MEIGIIGTGRMGSALARALAAAGHPVLLGSRDLDRSRRIALELGGGIEGTSNLEAGGRASLLFLAYHSNYALAAELRPVTEGKIVVDVSTYREEPGPDFNPLAEPLPLSQQEETQKRLPKARVFGAFQTTFAELFREPMLDGKRAPVFVVGDDAEAKRTLLELIGTLPFASIDGGALQQARVIANAYLLVDRLLRRSGSPRDWRTFARALHALLPPLLRVG